MNWHLNWDAKNEELAKEVETDFMQKEHYVETLRQEETVVKKKKSYKRRRWKKQAVVK